MNWQRRAVRRVRAGLHFANTYCETSFGPMGSEGVNRRAPRLSAGTAATSYGLPNQNVGEAR